LTRWALVVMIWSIAGCASSSPPSRPSVMLLVQADRLVTQGQYAGALEAYGEILAKYPDTDEAGRARSSRETLAGLLAARAQVTRLTADMKTQEAQLKAQEAELSRTREQAAARENELARARQEIARLAAEADRLRADLEHLKNIDIDLERRRK
jgi:chromosome segregation ATPase